MRLTKIEVHKLFGVFDHVIPLNLSDRITIIHGPNGLGKTVILSMIQSLVSNHFTKLRRVPFDGFSIAMENGKEISVTKVPSKAEGDKGDGGSALHFELKSGGTVHEYTLEPSLLREGVGFPMDFIERHIEDLERIGEQTWVNNQTGKQLDLDDVLENYGDMLPIRTPKRKKPPEWLTDLSQEFDVRLIEAQRLLSVPTARRPRHREGFLSFQPAVAGYSKELANSIQEVQAKYGTFSQQLDSTFPTRILQAQLGDSVNVDALTKKLQNLDDRRQRIIKAGLLTKEHDPAPLFGPQRQVDNTTKNILSIYSEDIEKKLGVFEEISGKVELFKEVVNKRFKYKHLDVERQKGFRLETSQGTPLSPSDLSSGEQHELVLLYELLFKTKPGALILIDEPELSLHVAWQVEFLTDLARVINLSSFDVLIATHSPEIINNRWDLTVELKGPQA